MNYYILKIILISCFFHCSSGLSEDERFDDVGSVILVNVVFRHGDRNPIDPYPNDPYRNLSYWPEGYGQLTALGMDRHYKFGQYIRQRYSHLLPAKYNLRDVLVRSTDVDRTLMSAQSNLAGMYPPVETWEPDLRWQPIPVHTESETKDSLLAMKRHCPRYEKEFKKVMESPEIVQINKENEELYNYVGEHAGRPITDPRDLEYVFSTLYIENAKNLKLPEWTKKVFPDQMSKLSAFSFTLAAYTKELQRLKGGPLLGDMVKHMQEKSQGQLSPDRKLFVYSAHDTTVSNLLMTLGVFDPQRPPYTAAVFVQLHRMSQGQFAVSILYRNDSSREPYPLQLPGCALQCPLQQFVALTKPVIPENWEEECGIRPEQLAGQDADLLKNLTIAAVVNSGILAILLVALMVISILYIQQKKHIHRYAPLHTNGL